MLGSHARKRWLAALTTACLPCAALAAPSFDALYADHGVLQRDRPMLVTGRADPGETVTVTLDGAKVSATTRADGHWQATLPAHGAGGPYVLEASAPSGMAQAQDMLVGDVWLCSGQSNMEFTVSQGLNAYNEATGANDPLMRMVTIPKATSATPKDSFGAPIAWSAVTPDSVPGFSAACYYMAKALRKSQDVPIGAINASWGGTQIRAWLDPSGISSVFAGREAELLTQFGTDPLGAVTAFAPTWEAWWRDQSGDKPGEEPWNAPDKRSWAPVPKIDYWERWDVPALANYNSLVWLRRTVTLTPEQAKQDLVLSLGIIDELDQTWVNGHVVGNTFSWADERHYRVPASYLHAGTNEIMVGAVDSWGNGGMKGPAELLKLDFADGSSMPLGEGWTYSAAPGTSTPPRAPWDSAAGLGVIYNGMVAPMGAYGLRGVAWYQGESDVGMTGYDKRLSALFKGWRGQFGQDGLPMIVVSLANYGPYATRPVASGWADLREEQRQAVRADSHAALTIAIDIGERTDIHPANKQVLGARLARAAEVLAYGADQSASGPAIASAMRTDGGILLRFDGVTGGLHSWSGGKAIAFELCGETLASCRYADAVASGDSVTIADDGKPATRIRYAWADSPLVNLFDEAELPVGPFTISIGK